jgi:hypothetical protein
MKKIKLNSSRLRLKKESIVNLTDKEQNAINGGHTASGDPKCVAPQGTFLCPVSPYPPTINCPQEPQPYSRHNMPPLSHG